MLGVAEVVVADPTTTMQMLLRRRVSLSLYVLWRKELGVVASEAVAPRLLVPSTLLAYGCRWLIL